MKKRKSRIAKYYIIFPVLLLTLFCQILYFSVVPSYAVLPSSYVTGVTDAGLDWQNADEYLDIDALKATVGRWFNSADYDFSALASDPVVIAVIDTGISFSHELFSGEYDADGNPIDNGDAKGKYDVFFRDSEGRIVCKNSVTGSTAASSVEDKEENRHGTHVSGIIAALVHELNLERYIKILPIKASNDTSNKFNIKPFQDALQFAVESGADVINISLGDSTSQSWANMDTKTFENAVCVAAAGNNISNKQFYPAAYSNVIGVMNYAASDSGVPVLSQTSNYGRWYDICAPGNAYYSADGKTTNGYKALSGTSMATPVVSFAAALVTLKYRALESTTGFEIEPVYVRNMLKMHSADSIAVDTSSYDVLDLNTLCLADFLNDEAYKAAIYCSDATAIDITVTNKGDQILGSLKRCELTASLQPLYVRQDLSVEWYCVYGEETYFIGRGLEAGFVPPSEVGVYGIYAKVAGSDVVSQMQFVNVKYLSISGADAKVVRLDGADYDNKLPLGETIKFSIENIAYANPAVSVKWYVNGEFVFTGRIFEFRSLYDGEYIIEAEYNNVKVGNRFAIDVDENLPFDINKVYTPLEWVSFAMIGSIVLSLAVFLLILYRRARKIGYF
jgi:hypothetical protein